MNHKNLQFIIVVAKEYKYSKLMLISEILPDKKPTCAAIWNLKLLIFFRKRQ